MLNVLFSEQMPCSYFASSN